MVSDTLGTRDTSIEANLPVPLGCHYHHESKPWGAYAVKGTNLWDFETEHACQEKSGWAVKCTNLPSFGRSCGTMMPLRATAANGSRKDAHSRGARCAPVASRKSEICD